MELEVQGRRAYAYTGGKALAPGAPAILLLHGAQQDHSCWVSVARWFVHHGHAVLAPDLPGHGRSAGDPLASVEAMAGWAVALLDAAGIERAAWVGHSMGSLIALAAAVGHAQRVTRIALVGSAAPMTVSDALLRAARDDEAKAFSMINQWSHGARGLVGGNPVPGLWMLGMNRRLMERQEPGTVHTDLAACQAYAGDGLEAVTCPALIVSGARDLMTPARRGRELAQRLRDARIVTLAGAGHSLMAEDPDGLLDALIEFLHA